MAERLKETAGDARVTPRRRLRDRFAASLGVSPEKKEEIYLQVSRSASLRDVSYWLQVLFAAGIATLGLILNSPAVIIGAMLISPLMGPILASGLALAAGDLVLGARAAASLALSCLAAVSFAVLLVAVLPFKEVTAEIAARTQPNTLDLVIALFSGAVGSVATCKEVKGVVTSIPGVAIAVALMPPLCVVGFGMGLALSVSPADGVRLAQGGGLLFLTNLVAIIFTAMVVFVALHIDTPRVRERAREWQLEDPESAWVRSLIVRLPIPDRLRAVGSLPGRFVAIAVTILLISIPLTQSFIHLRHEIARQQQENRIRLAATELWEHNFSRLPDGEPRCYLGQLSLLDREGKLALLLRVFTVKPYTPDEKAEYTRLVAARVGRPVRDVALRLIEIPTVSAELLEKARAETRDEALTKSETQAAQALTLAQMQSDFSRNVETALGDLRLPPPATLLTREVTTSAGTPPQLTLVYLSERDIEGDARELITDGVRARFENSQAGVRFERVATSVGPLAFARNRAEVAAADAEQLDHVGRQLQRFSSLRAEVAAGADRGERDALAEERARAVADYLSMRWQVAPERIDIKPEALEKRGAVVAVRLGESNPQQKQL